MEKLSFPHIKGVTDRLTDSDSAFITIDACGLQASNLSFFSLSPFKSSEQKRKDIFSRDSYLTSSNVRPFVTKQSL